MKAGVKLSNIVDEMLVNFKLIKQEHGQNSDVE